jgi:hypothetical protein
MERLPGLDQLGCGYDATKFYAEADSVRRRIFNLGRMDGTREVSNGITYSCPADLAFELGNKSRGSFETITGESAEEYRKSLMTKAGVSASYGLFSADVKKTFVSEQLQSINHKFVSVHHRFEMYKLDLPDVGAMTMTAQATAAINTNPITENLFKTYGTHVLMGAIIGGRAEYNCFVDSTKYTSSVEITTAAEAAYKGGLKISASFSETTKEAMEQFKSSSTHKYETLGGKFDKVLSPENFAEWMESFRKNPVLIDFTDDSLRPISELAADPRRREEIQRACDLYIQKTSELVPDSVPALEVRLVSGTDVYEVSNDDGSGAKGEVHFYKPRVGEGDFWIGHSANLRQDLLKVKGLIKGAVAAPLDYQKAWQDAGSGKNSGYSLWNIVAPTGYRALGGIARFGVDRSDHNKPSGAEVAGLVCIHESLCTEGMIGNQTWNNHGTRSRDDGGIWRILANGNGGIEPFTFYSHNHQSNKPNEKVYVISRTNRVKVRR